MFVQLKSKESAIRALRYLADAVEAGGVEFIGGDVTGLSTHKITKIIHRFAENAPAAPPSFSFWLGDDRCSIDK